MPKLTPEEDRAFWRRRAEGAGYRILAREFDIRPASARKRVLARGRREATPRPASKPPLPVNQSASVSTSERHFIREQFESGATISEIARRAMRTQKTIRRVLDLAPWYDHAGIVKYLLAPGKREPWFEKCLLVLTPSLAHYIAIADERDRRLAEAKARRAKKPCSRSESLSVTRG